MATYVGLVLLRRGILYLASVCLAFCVVPWSYRIRRRTGRRIRRASGVALIASGGLLLLTFWSGSWSWWL
jgi:hypothetical protein